MLQDRLELVCTMVEGIIFQYLKDKSLIFAEVWEEFSVTYIFPLVVMINKIMQSHYERSGLNLLYSDV